jgi:Ca2+-binding RTX toxin-like protein
MAGVAPGSAMAAIAWIDNGAVTYYAGGEDNQLSVVPNSGSTYRVDDLGTTISPATGCSSVNANRVTCSSFVFFLYLVTGAGDDTVAVSVSKAALIDAGGGNDTLTGGPSGDTFQGGTGTDEVSYSAQTTPVAVTLDDTANDGTAGENDNVRSDVENVTGGSAGDTLTGNGAANVLNGGAGDDTLNGGAGDDTLNGGDGSDSLQGGDGNDTIDSRDATADQVSCGADGDSVTADSNDTIAADCESVDVAASAGGPAGGPADDGGVVVSQADPFVSPGPVHVTRAGIARIPISCPAGGDACTGIIKLYELRRRTSTKGTDGARTSRRSRPKKVFMGRASFSVKAGEKHRVSVKLSRNGRRRVLRKGKVRCSVSVATVDSEGKRKVTTTKVTLKAPKRQGKRR